jgi:hypothetical protein
MNRKIQLSILIILLSLVGGYFLYQTLKKGRLGSYQSVIYNYGTEIDVAAKKYDIDASFLKSLCALESSGKSNPGSRFEPHVYQKLKKLKNKEIDRYDCLISKDINNASDEALKNLATSWGPFQLMGYKCLELGVTVKDLRGKNTIDHSVSWISKSYGHLIRAKRFEDAFHFHNTGKLVPKFGRYLTYDKSYVPRGVKYLKYFSNK